MWNLEFWNQRTEKKQPDTHTTKQEELKKAQKGYEESLDKTKNTYHDESVTFQESIKQDYTKIKWIVDEARLFSSISITYNSTKLNKDTFMSWNFNNNYVEDKEKSVKDSFTKYIVQGKLWSWTDPSMEEIYNNLVYYTPEWNNKQTKTNQNYLWPQLESSNQPKILRPWAWKLKYIMDNKWKDMETILKEIEKKEKDMQTQKPIGKEETKSFPEKAKNLLSKGYEFFIQWWRNLIAMAWDGIEYLWELVDNIYRFFKPFSNIKSSPAEKNPRTKVTLCSKTAQKNATNFWIKIPSGNAKEWVLKPIEDNQHFVETKKKQGNKYISMDEVAPKNANFADISVKSTTPNGARYWHRAVAFLDSPSMKWYVLDPYYSWGKWTSPIPLEQYPKHQVIEQVNFYNAPVQSKSA